MRVSSTMKSPPWLERAWYEATGQPRPAGRDEVRDANTTIELR